MKLILIFIALSFSIYSQEIIQINKNITATSIGGNLKNPWGIAVLPNNDLIVTEKLGGLKYYSKENNTWTIIQNTPTDVFQAGQGGFLDIVISPQFSTDKRIFFSYAKFNSTAKASALAVTRATLNGTSLSNVFDIFIGDKFIDSTVHFGGSLTFNDSDSLIVGTGDRGLTNEAQNKNSTLGKVIYLDPNATQTTRQGRMISYGHRNIQGITFIKDSLNIIAHEHGPLGGDEINLINSGSNYGWPIVSYGKNYNGSVVGSGQSSMQGVVEPKYQFTPSIAPSGLIMYRGNMFPYRDKLILGSLKFRSLYIMNYYGVNQISIDKVHEIIDLSKLGRIRNIAQGKDGEIYVVVDSNNTPLWILKYKN